jgi:competence protein ComEC
MSRADKVFYVAVAGFVAGIFVRSLVDWGTALPLFVLLISGVFMILHFAKPYFQKSSETLGSLHGDPRSRHFENVFRFVPPLMPLFLFAVALGMFWYELADRLPPTPLFDTPAVFEGRVVEEPDLREKVTRLVVQGLSLEQKAKVLVTTGLEPKYAYGDRLLLRGKVERPKNFEDEDTLREVNYVSYLAKDGIHYEMFMPRIEILAHGEGNVIKEKLFAFKHAFIGNINTHIPQPHAALLAGLVVGAKQSLGKKLLDDFRTVGVIHIVVLSGYNITIIARFIEWIFSALSRNRRLILAAGAIILFAIMVGASATVVRATIMAFIALLAQGTGRMYMATRALLIAGVIMLLHNPHILVFDLSFQLSFLATVGLIYFSPLIASKVRWITEKAGLREIVVATLATQLFVLPFILYKTGLFSLVSLPVNVLILAAIPLTMLFGFLAGVFGFVWGILALPFAWVAYALLAYELVVVEWFARLPFAAITLASFPAWVAALWYAVYGVVIWRMRSQSSFQPYSN